MRRLLSMAVLLGAIDGPARAAGPPEPGELLVGDGTSLVLVDPGTGTRTERGIASADVRRVHSG